MSYLDMFIITVGIITFDIIYKRINAKDKEIAHILALILMWGFAVYYIDQNDDLKKEVAALKSKSEVIRLEIVAPPLSNAEELQMMMDTMIYSLKGEEK